MFEGAPKAFIRVQVFVLMVFICCWSVNLSTQITQCLVTPWFFHQQIFPFRLCTHVFSLLGLFTIRSSPLCLHSYFLFYSRSSPLQKFHSRSFQIDLFVCWSFLFGLSDSSLLYIGIFSLMLYRVVNSTMNILLLYNFPVFFSSSVLPFQYFLSSSPT